MTDAGLWIQALFLGLVQGLTEFLPISSSAHLRIVSEYAGWEDPGAAFTAVTQIGTETAVVLYFFKDLSKYVTAFFRGFRSEEVRRSFDYRIVWYIAIGTIPVAVLGVLLESVIDDAFRNLYLIAGVLIGFGLLLGFADRRAKESKVITRIGVKDAFVLGMWQSLALIPGVSRSGGTITGGLFMGYTRYAATRFSFLLALPAVFAAGLFNLGDVTDESRFSTAQILGATVVAFVVGFAVIAWLLRYVSTHSFRGFVIYRLIVGTVLLVSLLTGIIDPLP